MTTSSTPRRFGLDNRGTKACESCGVLSWASRQNDTANQALCTACFDAAGWENSHQDGNHEPGSDPECPICDPERENRRLAKAAARVASYTASAAIKSAKAAQKELSYPHCPHCGDRRPKTKDLGTDGRREPLLQLQRPRRLGPLLHQRSRRRRAGREVPALVRPARRGGHVMTTGVAYRQDPRTRLNDHGQDVRTVLAALLSSPSQEKPMAQSTPQLAFARPSRHHGPEHIVRVDDDTLRPLSCTCEAGRRGLLCWAVIAITASDLEGLADRRWRQACGETDIRRAAAVVVQVRKWARAARELESIRSCGYVPVRQEVSA
jgi:hypothetical protein